MKRIISILLALTFIVAFAAIPAEAKILQECYTCGGTGKYKCDATDCVNGMIPCGCDGGRIIEKCGECNGSGKCRLCNGTGKRTGDPSIDCDNCKGTGKCQGGPGWGPCTNGYYTSTCPDCNGTGKKMHDNERCKWSREHDGKCPQCKGTGYEGDGVEGTPNDGVSNVPKPGDGIYRIDGSYYVYGGDSSGGNNNQGGNKENTTAATTKAADTTKAEEEAGEKEDPIAPAPQGSYGKTDVSYNPVKLSGNRQAVMYLGTPALDNDDFAGTVATGVVDYNAMSPEQKVVFDSISDEDLAQILGNVQGIISTVNVGDTADESKPFVDEFMKVNGISELKEKNILPITFEGHIEIGFPVRVSVEVDPNMFSGGQPIHVYHVAADGTITRLPDEDVNWITKGDGKVTRVEYYTDSFSDFLITDTPGLAIPEPMDMETEDSVLTIGAMEDTQKSGGALKTVIIVIVVIAIIGAAVFFILKNKKDSAITK